MRIPKHLSQAAPDLPDVPPPAQAEPLLAAFRALAALRREIAATVDVPLAIDFDPDRFAAGTPILAAIPAEAFHAGFLAAAAQLLPRLGAIFPPLGRDDATLAQALAMQPRLAGPLWDAVLAERQEDLVVLADELGLAPASLGFLSREIVGTVLRRLDERCAALAEDALWHRGSCPLCGGAPDIGMLREKREQSEFLVAKSGRLHLHCALCGHLWHFSRLRCPSCGENDQDKLGILYPAGRERERIHTCATCGHYLVVLNHVDSDRALDLDVAPAGLTHLDIVAQERGFAPLVLTPLTQCGAGSAP